MNDFLEKEEHCQCILNWFLKLVYVDGKFSEKERQLIKGFAATLNIQNIEIKECKDELSYTEIVFTLREMYRLALCDNDFHIKEQDLLNTFCSRYKIPENVVMATKKWVESLIEIENQFRESVSDYLEME